MKKNSEGEGQREAEEGGWVHSGWPVRFRFNSSAQLVIVCQLLKCTGRECVRVCVRVRMKTV